jgi:hypothetical protein
MNLGKKNFKSDFFNHVRLFGVTNEKVKSVLIVTVYCLSLIITIL